MTSDSREFRVILPTTQLYYWELAPFFELFNRYWGSDQEVVVLGDGDPELDYPNLTYFDMPNWILEGGLWINFSKGLRWYFENHMEEDHFVMLQTDFWLLEPMKLDLLRTVKAYMEAHDDVIRVGICPWHGSATNNPYLIKDGELDDVAFYRCKDKKPDCFLPLSNIPAMWNRELLYQVWCDNWTGWGCEQYGGERLLTEAEFSHIKTLVAKPPCLFWKHISYTRYKRVVLSYVSETNREVIRPFVPDDFEVH